MEGKLKGLGYLTIFHRVDALSLCSKCEEYLQEKGLPFKCLMLLDNAPAHPLGLKEDLVIEFYFIQVKFLSANTTQI